MIPRPQFRLRSLFILTAIVAVGCWVGPPIWKLIAFMAADEDFPVFQLLLFGSLVASTFAVQIINIVHE